LEVTTADTLPLDDAIAAQSLSREEKMETQPRNDSDVLLDLGEFEPVRAVADDEFVLDLDDDVAPPAYEPAPVRPFVEPQVKEAVAAAGAYESSYQPEVHSSNAHTQEVPYASEAPYQSEVPYASAVQDVAVVEPEPQPIVAEPEPAASSTSSIRADQLSPEVIDAIARRVVEMMSDKVVREIAWEVVPDLAELLIKRQLEENQPK